VPCCRWNLNSASEIPSSARVPHFFSFTRIHTHASLFCILKLSAATAMRTNHKHTAVFVQTQFVRLLIAIAVLIAVHCHGLAVMG
jgi:hypothetical protein